MLCAGQMVSIALVQAAGVDVKRHHRIDRAIDS